MEEYIEYIMNSKWLRFQLGFLLVYLPAQMVAALVFRSASLVMIGFLSLLVFLLVPFFAIDEPYYWWYMFTFVAAWCLQFAVDMLVSDRAVRNGEGMIAYLLPMSAFPFAVGISLIGRLLYILV